MRFLTFFSAAILAGALAAADALDTESLSADALVAEIVRRLDSKESAAELIQPAVERGMPLARACAAAFAADKPHRQEALCNLIAMAARCRQSHRETLRLYDPVAYQTFYSDAAEAEQARYAAILAMNPFPRQGAQALINAAPRPLLQWLRTQSRAAEPDVARLLPVWAQWGANIQFSNERQHVSDVQALAVEFLKNPRIAVDARTFAAAIRFAGECAAREAGSDLEKALTNAEASVRTEAVRALQRLKFAEPPAALVVLSRSENDAGVLLALAEALQNWHYSADAGAAALELFRRQENIEVRRMLVFSATRSTWPQREELLTRAFATNENSIVGATLQALGERPVPTLAAKTLALMAQYPEPPTPLIEALGGLRDTAASKYLIDALRAAQNPAVRLKIVLSLERVGGVEATAELIEQLKTTANVLFAQQVVAALGRMKASSADSVIASMAEDTTAPLAVRMQCIWALGSLPTPLALQSLKKMDADTLKYFGPTGAESPASQNEKADQCRLLLKMALFQQGEKDAEAAAVQLYRDGTPTTCVTMLMMLAQLKRDHPVIADGLASPEFAVMLAAVNAAGAADPRKYREALIALRDTHFVRAILDGGLNPGGLGESLRKAIDSGAGESR